MEHRQPQRGENGRRPQVGLDALHDRCQGEELAWRVHVEQLVDQIGCAVDDREPVTSPCSRGAPVGDLGRPLDVLGIELPVACVRPAAHIPADRAAVVPLDRSSRSVALTGPGELVRDQHPATRRATGREEIAHRDLEA